MNGQIHPLEHSNIELSGTGAELDTTVPNENESRQQLDEGWINKAELDPYWWTPFGFYRRLRSSKMMKFVIGNDVTVLEVDNLITLFSLVDALVLAVPFTIMSALNASTLDDYQTAIESCTSDQGYSQNSFSVNISYNGMYNEIFNAIVASTYIPLSALVFSLLYFTVRPAELTINKQLLEAGSLPSATDVRGRKRSSAMRVLQQDSSKRVITVNEDEASAINYDFRIWWIRGRYLMHLITLLTAASIVILIYVFRTYNVYFLSNSNQLCSPNSRNIATKKVDLGWQLLLSLVVTAFYFVV